MAIIYKILVIKTINLVQAINDKLNNDLFQVEYKKLLKLKIANLVYRI